MRNDHLQTKLRVETALKAWYGPEVEQYLVCSCFFAVTRSEN